MPKETHFTYSSADGKTKIHAVRWEPEGKVRGVVQIAHGMLEFIERYAGFAEFLNAHGIAVVGNDHLGHGSSVNSPEDLGYFAEKEGNRILLKDMNRLQRLTVERYPDVPYFLLGHSMGSFLARQYICIHGERLTGAVICGTGYHSALEANFGMLLCRIMALFRGWRHRSRMVTSLVLGSFNKRFEPARTPEDWLTRDLDVVDQYRADSRTRFTFTLNAYYNLFSSLRYLTKKKNLQKVPRDLPVFFVSGGQDPVGNFGAGVKKAALSLQGAGVKNVTCRLYPNDRHEILNELDKQVVYEDLLNWMEPYLKA